MKIEFERFIKLLERYCKYVHLKWCYNATSEIIDLYNRLIEENNPYLPNISDKHKQMLDEVFNYQQRLKRKEYPR